jgi:hypothetical protein
VAICLLGRGHRELLWLADLARVATGGAPGSFTAPVLIGGLAAPLSLPAALALPALLVAATALSARAVQPAGKLQHKETART